MSRTLVAAAFAVAAVVAAPRTAQAQAAVQVSATIVQAIEPPSTVTVQRQGGRLEAHGSGQPEVRGTMIINAVETHVVREGRTGYDDREGVDCGRRGEPCNTEDPDRRDDETDVRQHSGPRIDEPASFPFHRVVVTWTVAANA